MNNQQKVQLAIGYIVLGSVFFGMIQVAYNNQNISHTPTMLESFSGEAYAETFSGSGSIADYNALFGDLDDLIDTFGKPNPEWDNTLDNTTGTQEIDVCIPEGESGSFQWTSSILRDDWQSAGGPDSLWIGNPLNNDVAITNSNTSLSSTSTFPTGSFDENNFDIFIGDSFSTSIYEDFSGSGNYFVYDYFTWNFDVEIGEVSSGGQLFEIPLYSRLQDAGGAGNQGYKEGIINVETQAKNTDPEIISSAQDINETLSSWGGTQDVETFVDLTDEDGTVDVTFELSDDNFSTILDSQSYTDIDATGGVTQTHMFTDLGAGEYQWRARIEEQTPILCQGTSNELHQDDVQLTTNEYDLSISTPEVEKGIISGTIFEDLLETESLEQDDPRLENVPIEVFYAHPSDPNTMNQSVTTTTNSDGQYSVEVPTEDIRIEIDDSGDDFFDYERITTGDLVTEATNTEEEDTFNVGFFVPIETGEVQGSVFEDIQGTGKRDEGDPSLSDINLILRYINPKTNKEETKDVVTDENGEFSTSVPVGEVTIEVNSQDIPERASITVGDQTQTIDNSVDLDTAEVGFFIPVEMGEIQGSVFEDIQGTGKRDEGDPSLSDINLILRYINPKTNKEETKDVVTDENGEFSTSVPVGEVTIEVNSQDIPERASITVGDQTQTIDNSADLDKAQVGFFIQPEEQERDKIDLDTELTSFIRGYVFDDKEGNGVRDEGDPGLGNVEVTIFYNLSQDQALSPVHRLWGIKHAQANEEDFIETTTNPQGMFEVEVPPGKIRVVVDQEDPNIPEGAQVSVGAYEQEIEAVPGLNEVETGVRTEREEKESKPQEKTLEKTGLYVLLTSVMGVIGIVLSNIIVRRWK